MGNFDKTQNICRICLIENEDFKCVFDTFDFPDGEPAQFSEIIMACTEVEIILGDELPDQICSTCAQNTMKLYLFKIKCEESDKTLRNLVLNKIEMDAEEEEMLNNFKSEIKIENEEVSDSYCGQHTIDYEDYDSCTTAQYSSAPFNSVDIKTTLSIAEESFQCDESEENDLLNGNKVAEMEEQSLPAEVNAEATEEMTLQLLPSKSKDIYEKEYADFNIWREKKGETAVTEDVLLVYFLNVKKNFAPSSMWTKYSMLKATLKIHKNIDISSYGKLIEYLKSVSKSYKPKKSRVLERKHIDQFLKEADDKKYLMMKVALILGSSGGLRCNELTHLTIEDVKDKGSYLYISIPVTRTNVSRSFTILEESCFSVNVLEICKRYISLRPKEMASSGRFFLRYVNSTCTKQHVGINTLSRIPSNIATFLKLPNPETYTGHSMRRSSKTLLSKAGRGIVTLKRDTGNGGNVT